ncbi:MAG: AAA family ATPase [Rhizomicrobium sp.]
MTSGSHLVLTGPPGAGKSTVARLIAQASARDVVHLHTDDFYAWIAKGYVEPRKVEARAQNATVIAAIRDTAEAFGNGGYDVIVDGIVGPWFLDPFRGRGFDYVVLRPGEAETLRRDDSGGECRDARHAHRRGRISPGVRWRLKQKRAPRRRGAGKPC